jgi:acyl-CoA thioesterase YciA
MDLISTHICKGKDMGVHGNMFGGTMLAWLDEAGGAYASQCCDTPRMVTVRMGETLFKKPVRPGHLIKIYGEVVRCGTTSVTIKMEARRHSVYNGTQVLACTSSLVFVRVDGDGSPIPLSDKVRKKYKDANVSKESLNQASK